MVKQKNLPKLRFPQFKESWVNEKMGNLFSYKVTNSFSRDNLNYEVGTVKNIHYGDIHTKFQTLFDITKELVPFINPKISIDRISIDNYCQEGDLILADASEDLADVGKSIELVNLNNQKVLSGLHTILARPEKEKLSVGFCGYLFKSNLVRTQIQKESQGSKVLSISSTRLSNISLFIPYKEEQTRIASFFTVLDKKISQLKQKKNLLEQYKKGVMQKLFSQELRFKDENGNEFPKWEKEKIKGYIDFLSGFAFKGEDITEDSSGIPLLRGISITEGKLRRSEEIDRYYCGDTNKIYKYFLKKGDIVIGMDGSKVGKNSAIIDSSFENALLVQRVARIRGNSKGYLSFIYHHINSWLFHRYVDEVKTSSGIPHISASQINDFKIKFPCYKEQVKIGNFLNAIDEKLKRTENQLQQTQEYKKGLLQNMFC